MVYEPVELAQDLRSFDFMSPWEGAQYVLPGDEKAAVSPAPPPVAVAKTTDKPADTGAGKPADKASDKKVSRSRSTGGTANPGQGEPVPETTNIKEPTAPAPTEDRPGRKPRAKKAGNEGGSGPRSGG